MVDTMGARPIQTVHGYNGGLSHVAPVIGTGGDGPPGPAGESFNLLAAVADEAALPSVGNSDGDARMTEDTGHIWQWHGDTETWVDGGQWQGPPGSGDIDTVVAGANIDVDATDPQNPIVSVENLTAADIGDFDTEVGNQTDVAANTAARHTHANMSVLNATTASFTTADETKLDGIAAGATTDATVDAHIADATDAHDASAISSVAAGTLSATDVQAALNELDTEKATTGSVSTVAGDLTAHISDATDAHAGSAITNTPAGNIAATTVQAAINELDTEKATTGSVSTVATDLSNHIGDTADAHDASAISFTPAGTIAATDVQAAIEEVAAEAGDGAVASVVAGTNIDVDATDPANPIVSVETLTLADISDVTASAAEVNFTDGVTSAIQTQIDGKQASDADLTAIAGLAPSNDDVIQRKAGAWTNRTPAQVKTDLTLVKGDVGLGNVDNTSDATKNSASATLTNKLISGVNNSIVDVPLSSLDEDVTNATTLFDSGTVPTARLGSGTADLSAFLRGDQTWQQISSINLGDLGGFLDPAAIDPWGAEGTVLVITGGEAAWTALTPTGIGLLKSSLVADVALSGNGTENVIQQLTIPANKLAAGTVIKVTMYISGLTGVTALTPRLRLGTAGTTSDLQVGNGANTTVTPILNHGVKVEFNYTQRVAGGAGTATANCNMTALAGNSAVAGGQQIPLPTATAATLSTTVQNICSVTLAQATATATVTQCVIEVLP